jgi:hypothetical protein
MLALFPVPPRALAAQHVQVRFLVFLVVARFVLPVHVVVVVVGAPAVDVLLAWCAVMRQHQGHLRLGEAWSAVAVADGHLLPWWRWWHGTCFCVSCRFVGSGAPFRRVCLHGQHLVVQHDMLAVSYDLLVHMEVMVCRWQSVFVMQPRHSTVFVGLPC